MHYFILSPSSWQASPLVVFMLLLVMFFVLISVDPPIVLFSGFVAYSLSGYVMWFWERRKQQSAKAHSHSDESMPDK